MHGTCAVHTCFFPYWQIDFGKPNVNLTCWGGGLSTNDVKKKNKNSIKIDQAYYLKPTSVFTCSIYFSHSND